MDVVSLIDVMFNARKSIEPQVLDKLVKSMQKRCSEVVVNKGCKIDYEFM